MKLYRVRRGGGAEETTYAVRRGGAFVAVETELEELMGAQPEEVVLGERLDGVTDKDALAPVDAGKIVCVGRNYRAHARELGNAIPEEPLIFLKPPSAVVGPGRAIELPAQSREVHHEAELAVVIGRRARNLETEDVDGHLLGYTCANDVTARDLQRRDKTFTRAKGFDTFCPLGPTLKLAAGFRPADHGIVCRVNGRERQSGGFDDFIFGVEEVVAYISQVMTLQPGDVVLTGTPSGVGPLEAGDTVDVAVESIGTLRNPVVA